MLLFTLAENVKFRIKRVHIQIQLENFTSCYDTMYMFLLFPDSNNDKKNEKDDDNGRKAAGDEEHHRDTEEHVISETQQAQQISGEKIM